MSATATIGGTVAMRFVTSRQVGDVLILVIDDPERVQADSSDLDRPSLDEILVDRTAPRVAVDLQSIEYLSSAGIAGLVTLRRKVMSAGGRLVLFGVQSVVQDLLQITHLTKYFQFATSQDDAVHQLRPIPPA